MTDIVAIFKAHGLYHEFDCADCRARDFAVTGPHGHSCVVCGGRAQWGFYLTPLCDSCKGRGFDHTLPWQDAYLAAENGDR